MRKNLKNEIMRNRDDLIEGTFCYLLFEEGIFDESLLIDLINNSNYIFKECVNDDEVIDLLVWVINGVDQCFLSNNDKNDLYTIKNHRDDLENKWRNDWKPMIIKITQDNKIN